jgi:hypothetical protein
MDVDDYDKRFGRIDWMLTAHSILRDGFGRRSQGLTLAVIALSVIGLAFALANGDQQVSLLGLNSKLQVLLALFSGLTFFVGLVDLVVDWRRRAWMHEDAARRLRELKATFVRAEEEDGQRVLAGIDLAAEYDSTMGGIVSIPDRRAAALKARHARKVELFKRVDRHPGAPRWCLRLLVLGASLKSCRQEQEQDRERGG